MVQGDARRGPRFVYLSNAPDANAPGGRYGWRFVAANNRGMARGVGTYESLPRCESAVLALRSAAEHLSLAHLFDDARGTWTWRASQDGATVAVCVNGYQRRFECARAGAQFVAALSTATACADRVRYLGFRGLRHYETTGQ